MAQQDIEAPESGFRATWAGTDLGRFRPSRGTYELYPIESLPPLPQGQFTGSYDWFGDPGAPVAEHVAALEQVSGKLGEAGLALPEDFVALMTREHLYGALDEVSCTCCWTYLAGPFESPVDPAARLVLFFRDQQDCVLWYLYLRPAADGGTESFVVHSFQNLGYEEELRAEGSEEALQELKELTENPYSSDVISWCAPSAEQFAYRNWIEGKLWFSVSADPDSDAFTPGMRAYLSHYKEPQGQA